MLKRMSEDHITEKQKNYIMDLIEHSDYPLDPIDLKSVTKQEASEWIKKNWKLAHERVDQFGFY
jgi:predicted DNA-binding protein YlxM (UPF0122 family)